MKIKGRALGLIETYGYIGAIEASDVALKSAQVELLGLEKVKGGYVTTKFVGDVGAVKAAVEAAEGAVRRMNVFVSSHVIARPSDDLEQILMEKKEDLTQELVPSVEIEIEAIEEVIEEVTEEVIEEAVQAEIEETIEEAIEETTSSSIDELESIETEEVADEDNNESTGNDVVISQDITKTTENIQKKYTEKELQAMKVVRLRALARNLEGISVERKDIKFANKKRLVDAIMQFYGRKKE